MDDHKKPLELVAWQPSHGPSGWTLVRLAWFAAVALWFAWKIVKENS